MEETILDRSALAYPLTLFNPDCLHHLYSIGGMRSCCSFAWKDVVFAKSNSLIYLTWPSTTAYEPISFSKKTFCQCPSRRQEFFSGHDAPCLVRYPLWLYSRNDQSEYKGAFAFSLGYPCACGIVCKLAGFVYCTDHTHQKS